MLSPHPILVQIVPWVRPGRCGVSDHAIALARELLAAFETDAALVAFDGSGPGNLEIPVVQSTPADLLKTCVSLTEGRTGAVLVHLSGYGYSPDGIPALLADALTQTKAGSGLRIAVYFHELFAVGPPWKSAFWHSRRQQAEVRRIARLCDLLVTNTQHHAEWLEQQMAQPPAAALQCLPVFSTAGEARELVPFALREPVMTVFGLAGTRKNAYSELHAHGKMLGALGIRQIIDIGPGFEPPTGVNGIAVKRMGEIDAREIASLLAAARFGFVPHPGFCLAKSSIFAAYCAHGVIPVAAASFRGEMDGLTDGMQVLSPISAAGARPADLERSSAAAWQWYANHRLRTHAETYWRWLSKPSAELIDRTCAVAGTGEA